MATEQAAKVATTADPMSAIFGTAMGLAAQPGGPSNAMGGTQTGSKFDNSGWSVSFGSSKLNADRTESTGLDKTFKYVLLGAAFLVAVKWLKTKKKTDY